MSQPGPQVSGRNHWLSGQINLTREFMRRKTLNGPAMRPTTPHVTENSVGEQSTCFGWCQMIASGKSAWRAPTPHFVPSGLRSGRGFLFFCLYMLGGIHGKILARSSVPVFISATPKSRIMGKIYNNIVETVGGTPLVRLNKHLISWTSRLRVSERRAAGSDSR